MEKRGPVSIVLTYDFVNWVIPALKKFPPGPAPLPRVKRMHYNRDGTTLLWRPDLSRAPAKNSPQGIPNPIPLLRLPLKPPIMAHPMNIPFLL